jgi:hypothetical protein
MKTIVLILVFVFSLFVCNAQTSKIITNLTPGNLINTMTQEELNTTTFLSLAGSIDARDFKTMRDLMPVLEEVELTNATVAEYTGVYGTSVVLGEPVSDITYPANAIPMEAFSGKKSLLLVTLPGSINTIMDNAFFMCENLFSVYIPSSVTSIQMRAFMRCRSLRSVMIPASVEDIGLLAFSASTDILYVDEKNPRYAAIDGVLFSKDQTLLISCPVAKSGRYDIPETVTRIEDYAFLGCENLISVYIPNSVTQIGNLAFSECRGLSEITIPYSITAIGIRTFMYCDNLRKIYLPSSLTAIGSGAFSYCTNMTSFNIPFSVTLLGDDVFKNCTNLTVIYATPVKPVVLTSNIFQGINPNCKLYVPKESLELYKAAPFWKDFLNMEGILTSVESPINTTLSVFPNPAKDVITINADKGVVSIYNSQGKLAMIQILHTDKKVNVSTLAPGIYVGKVNGESFKMVKE